VSALFPFAEKAARWILRHDRRHQQEVAIIRDAADRAAAIYADEPFEHPGRYPDMVTLAAAQEAWKVRSGMADDAAWALATSRIRA
jgi:hypothetical protein